MSFPGIPGIQGKARWPDGATHQEEAGQVHVGSRSWGKTLVGRDSAQRVWQLIDVGYGLFYVALPNPQESYYIHKIVDLNRFFFLVGIR